jgi:hypothetical protein
MRPLVLTLGLAAGVLALAPRAAAQEQRADAGALRMHAAPAPAVGVVALEAPGQAPSPFAAAPYVGVERANAFRAHEPNRSWPRAWTRLELAPPARPEPVDFAAQAEAGLLAFHLTVYADPGAGRYARGGARRDAALGQAGLKVVDPEAPDGDALCATLMICLQSIDAVARARAVADPTAAPLIVVVDARPAPHPEPRLLRVAASLIDDAPSAPAWPALFAEIAVAVPDLDASRMILVLAGGRGAVPDRTESFGRGADAVWLAGEEARLLYADAAPEAVGEAVMSGAFTIVFGADWSGEGDPARLGPREAAGLGAHAVLVTPEAARERR